MPYVPIRRVVAVGIELAPRQTTSAPAAVGAEAVYGYHTSLEQRAGAQTLPLVLVADQVGH